MSDRAGTRYDKDDDRWYIHPGNPTKEFAGVTSVLGTRKVTPIEKAKINGVARYAARNRKELATKNQAEVYQILKDQDTVLPDWNTAREFGSAAHQVIENVINGKPLGHMVKHVEGSATYPCDNTFTEWVPRHWREFTLEHDVKVIDSERSVVSDKFGYAGSFDYLLAVDGELAFVDAKTNAKGPHLWQVAMQNEAYRRADYILDFVTGEQSPLPSVAKSYVLWLRPEGWNLWPLPVGGDVWRTFYAHLLLFQASKSHMFEDIEPIHEDGLQPPPRWGG